MRFTAISILGLAAIASAQSSSRSASSTVSAISTTTSLTPEQTCLAACGAADICCQARCVNVPCPNELQANTTTECAAKCNQGDGSQEQTEQYAACQQACISSSFFPLTATAAPSGGSGGSGGAGPTTSGSGSGNPSATGSGSNGSSSPTTTPNAAAEARVVAAGAGLLGLVAAILAL